MTEEISLSYGLAVGRETAKLRAMLKGPFPSKRHKVEMKERKKK